MPTKQTEESTTEHASDHGVYIPSEDEKNQTTEDKEHIDSMYSYRARFEKFWLEAGGKWNMLAPVVEDDSPNYVVPISRMATYTGIVSMRQSTPEAGIRPRGTDDKRKAYFLREASAHVDSLCGMEEVMDQFVTDYAVLGTGVLEDFVKIPYKTQRKMIVGEDGKPTGKYKNVIRRDWSRPKLGTRARSPWECAFDPGARSHGQIRACTFNDRLSFDEFKEEYVNIPEDGPEYKNTEFVEDGFVWSFNASGDMERMKSEKSGVVITHYQNELTDTYRIYANGIMIYDVPLSSLHKHGKITLSLAANHHKYDESLKTHAIYGAGDPELLADLDDLINAMTNMFIDNYQKKNTPVVSIDGGGLDVDEVDYLSGMPVAGKVTIQSLGQADLPEFNNFKTIVEDWAVQMVKKNYKRLEGETAKTAFEAQQKQKAENVGMAYQVKKLESTGLHAHKRKRISDIMEHMTVEEYEEILEEDIERVEKMVGKELSQSDIVYNPITKKPHKVRYVERFRTRGRVFEEVFENGVRTIDSLREVQDMAGEDGFVAAAKEYLWTSEYALFGYIPDVYVVGKTMMGEDSITELAKLERLYANLQATINLQIMEEQSAIKSGIDWMKLFEKTLDIVGIDKEEIMTEQTKGDDLKAIGNQIKSIITQSPDVLPQQSNAGGAGIVPAGQNQSPVNSSQGSGVSDPLLQAGMPA